MTPNQQKAIELYDAASRGRCGFGISGDSMRDTRQTIMHLLTGVKMPKAQCGTNAVEDAITKAKNYALPGMETAQEDRAAAREELLVSERGTIEDLPAGTFKDSGTNVNTVLLTIEA